MSLKTNELVVATDELNKVYKLGDVEVEVLKGITLKVARGDFVAICGPSGSGKTTLLNIISGIDRPTSGKVFVLGEDLTVFDLNEPLEKNAGFLEATWSVIMFLPLFSLVAATLSLIAYLVLVIDEQRHEFAVLRAMGAKSKTVIAILAVQSLLVLLSSFAIGISFGVIITLMILMAQPVVTSYTLILIAGWLFAALFGMFILSFWPALRFAKKPILKIMS
jgi:ABC-type branched-subunit amino acid transport system ATPase component